MSESLAEAEARYLRACHAMQSGVALEHSQGSNDGSPKHLRVGINSAHVSTAALLGLLIEKGLLTYEEYVIAVADQMEAEVALYEARNKGVTFK